MVRALWQIDGTGNARRWTQTLRRRQQNAQQSRWFSNKYGIEKVYEDLNDMFYDDNVDVIYITSPHNTHIDFIMKALENGKHILSEKSITLNSVELEKALKNG